MIEPGKDFMHWWQGGEIQNTYPRRIQTAPFGDTAVQPEAGFCPNRAYRFGPSLEVTEPIRDTFINYHGRGRRANPQRRSAPASR